MRDKKWLMVVAGVAVVIIGAIGYFLLRPADWQQLTGNGSAQSEERSILASGFIEAEEISIAPEVGGRIVELNVSEGDVVDPGDVLVRLDETIYRAQVDIAQAGLEVAEATLDQIQAGSRSEQIRQAEAALAQAEAGRDGAYQAWMDVQAIIDNPQDIDLQITLATAQRDEAEAALTEATAMRDAVEIAHDALGNAYSSYPDGETERILAMSGSLEDLLGELPPELITFIAQISDGTYTYNDWEITLSGGNLMVYRIITYSYPLDALLLPNDYWRAWAGYNAAQAAYDGAQRSLNTLYGIRNDPQELQAQRDAAEAQYHAAEAMVGMARAQLAGLRAGATTEEIAAVEAQVLQAQAQLDSALLLLEKLSLEAPSGGWVLEMVGHQGELAVPGAPLVTLANLDQVMLTVYVPENRLGYVQVGQQVEVMVDSFPDRVFLGHVATIASEAEFTPRNVQTQEERVNMVFAVKVVIPNSDYALKPGMPADAEIIIE
jgi:multidrug resistance efflux pump